MFRKLLTLCAAFLLFLAFAYAAPEDNSKDVQKLQKESNRLDSEAASMGAGNQAVFDSLSKQLNIPVATLQAEQQSTKFGYGQLFIANSLAQATGKSFEQISQEFQSGKGWGQIANENNVKLGKIVSGLKSSGNQLRDMKKPPRAQANSVSRQAGSQQQGPAANSRGKGRPR